MSQQADRKATHGWGSSPSQRHYVSHEQALKMLEAGVKRAKEIKCVQSYTLPLPFGFRALVRVLQHTRKGSTSGQCKRTQQN